MCMRAIFVAAILLLLVTGCGTQGTAEQSTGIHNNSQTQSCRCLWLIR